MAERTVALSELVNENLVEVSAGRPRSVNLDRYPLPILRVADVLDGKIESSLQGYTPFAWQREMGPKASRPGDVVLTTKGSVGRVAIMPPEGPCFAYSPQLCYFRPVVDGPLKSRYLYYWFKSADFWRQADALKGQTDMADFLSLRDIYSLKVRLPSLVQQEGVIDVLGALDDKIAVNERIAAGAAELAMTHGRHIVEGACGPEVPLGGEVCVTKGNSYRSADLGGGGNWLVSLKCIGRDRTFRNSGLKEFSGEFKESQVLADGDVVVAHTDLTQKAEIIGRPVRVATSGLGGRFVASLDLAIVRPRALLSSEYILALLSTSKFRDHAMGYCNGTTVIHMSVKALPEFRFALPEKERVDSLSEVMSPLFVRSDHARVESMALASLRDTLLPLLMSGKLRVRDAERIVEDAV